MPTEIAVATSSCRQQRAGSITSTYLMRRHEFWPVKIIKMVSA